MASKLAADSGLGGGVDGFQTRCGLVAPDEATGDGGGALDTPWRSGGDALGVRIRGALIPCYSREEDVTHCDLRGLIQLNLHPRERGALSFMFNTLYNSAFIEEQLTREKQNMGKVVVKNRDSVVEEVVSLNESSRRTSLSNMWLFTHQNCNIVAEFHLRVYHILSSCLYP